jgi:hypothetical protein
MRKNKKNLYFNFNTIVENIRFISNAKKVVAIFAPDKNICSI